ncbi:MAG: hypothetical protein ACOYJJ_01185 [Anaerovoracaceae bacterium]|jgi:hypothetical protein
MEQPISQQYGNLYQILHDLLQGRAQETEDDAYWIIWISVATILHQCDFIGIEEVMQQIMFEAAGTCGGAVDIYAAVRDDRPEFEYITKRYKLSKEIAGMGTAWKEVLAEGDPAETEVLFHLIDIFYNSLMGYSYRKVVEFEKKHQLFEDPQHFVFRKKAFSRYKAIVRTSRSNILAAVQVMQLMKEDNG